MELLFMHAFFCTDSECGGVTDPSVLDDSDTIPTHACVYAKESIWALRGIKYGFKILRDEIVPEPSVDTHYPSDPATEAGINRDIKHEWRMGWLLTVPATMVRHCCPVFGKQEADKLRVIKDYTACLVNDACKYVATSMMNIRNAIPYLQPYAYMFKVDVASAFRAIPIYPQHTFALHYHAFGRFFRDLRAPFGLRPSPHHLWETYRLNTPNDAGPRPRCLGILR